MGNNRTKLAHRSSALIKLHSHLFCWLRCDAMCLVISSGTQTTTLLVEFYSILLKEGHVILLIHDQYSLVVIFHAF
jgi:hypothetical protein